MVDDPNARKELEGQIDFEKDQFSLFSNSDAPLDWQKEWQGMPEFAMGNREAFQKITMSFKTWDDVKKFGQLIGQPVSRQTDTLWFPKQDDYLAPKNYRYVDES